MKVYELIDKKGIMQCWTEDRQAIIVMCWRETATLGDGYCINLVDHDLAVHTEELKVTWSMWNDEDISDEDYERTEELHFGHKIELKGTVEDKQKIEIQIFATIEANVPGVHEADAKERFVEILSDMTITDNDDAWDCKITHVVEAHFEG